MHSPLISPTVKAPTPTIIRIPDPPIGIVESPAISYSLPIVMPNLGLTLSGQHVYWVDMESPTAIKRLSLQQPTTPEIVAQGIYTDGVVSNIEVSGNNEWLVYWERASQYIGGEWKLTAIHLENNEHFIIFDSTGAPFENEPILSLALVTWDLGFDEIAINYTLATDQDDCQRIVTRTVNLSTRNDQIVAETDCGRKEAILLWPQIDDDRLAAEQDYAAIDGGGVDIALYEQRTQRMQLLTSDRMSMVPQISAQYVIWKRLRSANTSSNLIGVFDLTANLQRTLEFPMEFGRPLLHGQWLFIDEAWQPLYLYNLAENTFVLVAASKNCYGSFTFLTMNGNIVAWIRSSGLLEWRAIDPAANDPYIGCEEIPV